MTLSTKIDITPTRGGFAAIAAIGLEELKRAEDKLSIARGLLSIVDNSKEFVVVVQSRRQWLSAAQKVVWDAARERAVDTFTQGVTEEEHYEILERVLNGAWIESYDRDLITLGLGLVIKEETERIPHMQTLIEQGEAGVAWYDNQEEGSREVT